MATQKQVAAHLDISQQAVSEICKRLGIDWLSASLDDIRVRYLRHLRGLVSGHVSSDGHDLVKERVLTERIDRDLKELQLAEKRGTLINVQQLEPALMQMVSAFRAELLARDDKLKAELDSVYGINTDLTLLTEYTNAALSQLARYDQADQG